MNIYILIATIFSLQDSLVKSTTTNFSIVCDVEFQRDMKAFQEQNTTDAGIKYIPIFPNNSLQNIWSVNWSDVKDGSTVFLFTKMSSLVEQSLQADSNIVTFGSSLYEMLNIHKYHSEGICLLCNSLLRRSIVALARSISLLNIAIVTDENNCTLEFYRRLKQSLEELKDTKLNVQHINYQIHEQSKHRHLKFYHLKAMDVGLIILLVPVYYINNVIKEANRFSLLDNSHIWLIPNYRYDMIDNNTSPNHVFTIEFPEIGEEGSMFNNLPTSLPVLVNNYEKYKKMCEKRNSSLNQCLSLKLCSQLIEIEYAPYEKKFTLVVPSINSVNTDGKLEYLKARIDGDQFFVLNNNITRLNEIGDDRYRYQTIRAVVLEEKPYLYEDKLRYQNITDTCSTGMRCMKRNNESGTVEATCCVGFLIEFLELILLDVNVNIDMYFVEDGQYGAFNNGKWNGIIGDILAGKADFGVAPVTVNEERYKAVQFTVPWLTTKLGFVTKPKITSIDFVNFEFMSPLESNLKIAIMFTIFGMVGIAFIMENISLIFSLFTNQRSKEPYYSLNESFSYTTGVALQRDIVGENPRRKGTRFAAIIYAFGMVIIITTYTATLVEQGVYRQEKDPFIGTKDTRFRNPTNKYLFSTLKSSSYGSYFKNSNFTVYKRISQFMEPRAYSSVTSGVDAVNKRILDSYMDEYLHLTWFVSNQHPCSLRVIPDDLLTLSLSFPTSKTFLWRSAFNEVILKYRESRILHALHSKWFKSGGCELTGPGPFTLELGISNFGGLFVLVMVTMAICFALLLPEYVYWIWLREKMRKKIMKILDPDNLNKQSDQTTELMLDATDENILEHKEIQQNINLKDIVLKHM